MNNDSINYEFEELESVKLKDYIALIRNNFLLFFLILLVSIVAATFYAIQLPDIYISSSSLKINKTSGNILTTKPFSDFGDLGNDRFLNNEIEILKSYNLRELVAKAISDSIEQSPVKNIFKLFYPSDNKFESANNKLLSTSQIVDVLGQVVNIEQKKGLDIIIISAESPSAKEAALIAKLYANSYRTYNLEINRDQLTYVRKFLDQQRNEKRNQLQLAEDTLRAFQEKGGIIALDEQAQALITQLSQFEAQMNAAKIELTASDEVLKKYKEELIKQDPKLADYLESATSESYIKALQNQIAELQLNKDLALAKFDSGIDITQKIKEYDNKIKELKNKLDEKILILKSGIFASSPEEVRRLSQKIIEEEVKNQTLKSTVNSLNAILKKYEERFNKLPKTTIEFARFQRTRESTEKLFTLIEEKYQEALINEESQPGNVLIIDDARIPNSPSKPNRKLIILAGFLIGFLLSFGTIFIKNYFDNTIKTPEDIEKKNTYVLAWIPKVTELNGKNGSSIDFLIEQAPNSVASEAIRALRTRVQFSKSVNGKLKTILITSPAPQEGKSTISINLATSFAHSNRRTLLLDADLRKPRLHQVFKMDKEPGLVNYLFGEITFDKILNTTNTRNLFLITSGTIAANPSEILESDEMQNLLNKVRNEFDYVIIDSPPIVAVTDAEILSRKVDGTVLVVSANNTERELLERGVQLLKNEHSQFLGTVLNNFSSKPGYGSYYKYYYYYSSNGKKSRTKQKLSKGSKGLTEK